MTSSSSFVRLFALRQPFLPTSPDCHRLNCLHVRIPGQPDGAVNLFPMFTVAGLVGTYLPG